MENNYRSTGKAVSVSSGMTAKTDQRSAGEQITLYFSGLLQTIPAYRAAAQRLFGALDAHNVPYGFLENTRDIWVRDFMPVKTRSGKYVSFRYEPDYLDDDPGLKTDFRADIREQLSLQNIVYSEINLDGGNVVFSPSKTKAVVSDRVFAGNDNYSSAELVRQLEQLLEARVIIIPSLRSDMTGHADGMVRFVDEHTAIGNRSLCIFGLEQHIKAVLRAHGIEVINFPYFDSKGDSAVGCYLNYLETGRQIFLPVFGVDMDCAAINAANGIFDKTIVPVNVREIAVQGGALNCVSWENKKRRLTKL